MARPAAGILAAVKSAELRLTEKPVKKSIPVMFLLLTDTGVSWLRVGYPPQASPGPHM